MPRTAAQTSDQIIESAMHHFWHHGYSQSSMDDIVKVTGSNRQAIYQHIGGKKKLFVACFPRYQEQIVGPAMAAVEADGAPAQAIATYFEVMINRMEAEGLPGPGCLIGNTMAELPKDLEVLAEIDKHFIRLWQGFTKVITASSGMKTTDAAPIAESIVIFANGLWSVSRVTDDASSLRNAAQGFLSMLQTRLRKR
ncbi:TetR/AcrR family transcriptional regulator [Pseudooceanicola sp. C21-150M6]|uniref:TetR/AcrR family transcriptional regulator n=1 Tax=Pseudooceanicola sp. C21-150M6 TaxID=3434355 RepID=UPI003D7F627C